MARKRAAGRFTGADDPAPTLARVVINEVLSASVPPDVGQNRTVQSHRRARRPQRLVPHRFDGDLPRKFRIPEGTVLALGAFVVFTEADFNAAPGATNNFSLSSAGEQVYLVSADLAGNLTGYTHGFSFGAAEPEVSLAATSPSAGEEQFPAQTALTFGAANAGPRVGPVVFTEIHYHPRARRRSLSNC